MVAFQWLTISMILIVLLLIHIDASNHRSVRQTTINKCLTPDIPACDFVQCVNGRCEKDENNINCYQCLCSPGYVGQLCDETIVLPTSCNPGCQNGGQCVQTPANTFVCQCPAEYTGNQCQTSLPTTHVCVTMPGSVCKNGGTCLMNGADYTCNCATGWTGPTCEIQEHNCPIGFCQNGGTCRMNGMNPYCNCPTIYIGQRCETLISVITTTPSTTIMTPFPITCSTNPCFNGGTCFNTGNTFVCLCKQEWSGPTCSIPSSITTPTPTTPPPTTPPPTTPPPTTPPNANPCNPNPCHNEGACFRNGNGYVCVCKPQFTGLLCDVPRITTTPAISTLMCTSQPCQNGGTCFNSGNSYFCYCGANGRYTGKNCEIANAPSVSNCPLNCAPGYCVNTGGSQNGYACICNGVMTPTRCPLT